MPRSEKLSQKMRAQSHAQILDAARRLFAEKGYFNCKVSDIAQAADMSQGNIYWYFSGKQDVLKAVLADGFEALNEVLVQAQAHPGSGQAKLAYAIDQYLAFGRERGNFVTIFMSLLAHGGVPFLQELGFDTSQIGMGYHHYLSAILAQAQEEGSVADADPNMLATFFFGFFNGLMITYGQDWLNLEPETIKEAALRLLGGDVN